jgi:hypothetical protein
VNVDSILISDYAQITAGKLTVVGVFNRIQAKQLPVRLPTLALSMVIHAHHDEAGSSHDGEVKLLNQDRVEIVRRPLHIRFSEQNLVPGLPLRAVSTTVFLAPQFDEPGAYAFEVYIDGTYHAAASFVVLSD